MVDPPSRSVVDPRGGSTVQTSSALEIIAHVGSADPRVAVEQASDTIGAHGPVHAAGDRAPSPATRFELKDWRRVRALLPRQAEGVDVVDAYALPDGVRDDRPFVRCNMISSLDGAIAVEGRSGMLGGRADRNVFQVLRSLADVIVVGAGTVRAEGYGPARLDPDLRRRREERGQSPLPPIAVVTRSGNLDWSSPFFTEAEARPIVLAASDVDPGVVDRGTGVADFVMAGTDRVDPAVALDALHRKGFRSVLLEGGPGLNSDVLEAGRMDELCLTFSPRLVGGSGPRVFAGPELPLPVEVELVQLLEEDGFLFSRLLLVGRDHAPE
jgi:riboflavin biosynthesis pyrimidine reductase